MAEVNWQEQYISKLNEDVSEIKQELKNNINDIKIQMQEQRTELRAEMQAMKSELKSDMQAMRAELKSDMQAMKAEIKSDMQASMGTFIAELRDRDNQRHAEIMEMRAEMSNTRKWIIGLAVATGLSVLAIGGSVIFGMVSIFNILASANK